MVRFSGGFRISLMGATPWGGGKPITWPIFAENCMKQRHLAFDNQPSQLNPTYPRSHSQWCVNIPSMQVPWIHGFDTQLSPSNSETNEEKSFRPEKTIKKRLHFGHGQNASLCIE